jgi:ATP-dependent protease ClpP protease subunit
MSTEQIADQDLVTSHGNSVFFYAPVSNASVMLLHQTLHKVASEVSDIRDPVIYLYVNSEGGDFYAGLAAMDHIQTFRIPVVTIVEGLVASAATLIAIAGHQRYIMPHASLLVHQISLAFDGKHQDMVDEYKNSRKEMKLLKNIYIERTGMTAEEVDACISRERKITSRRAIKLGFARAFHEHLNNTVP